MSRTIRKDKEGNKFKEGNPLGDRNVNYRCRCGWCTGTDRLAVEEKIADRDMKRQLKDAQEWNYTENLIITEYNQNKAA